MEIESQKYLYSQLLSNPIQLTLEQHRFELRGSTYTRIFFSSKYYTLQDSKLVESMDAKPDTEEPHIQRADCK